MGVSRSRGRRVSWVGSRKASPNKRLTGEVWSRTPDPVLLFVPSVSGSGTSGVSGDVLRPLFVRLCVSTSVQRNTIHDTSFVSFTPLSQRDISVVNLTPSGLLSLPPTVRCSSPTLVNSVSLVVTFQGLQVFIFESVRPPYCPSCVIRLPAPFLH